MSNTNMLIKFSQTQGESTEVNHVGYSNLFEWNYEMDRPESWGSKGGSAEGKAIPRIVRVIKAVDTSTPILLNYLAKGTAIKFAHLVQKKSAGENVSENYLDLKFQEVYIKEVKLWVNPDSHKELLTPHVSVSFMYNYVSVAYKPQDQTDHKLGKTNRFTYDVRTNNTDFDASVSSWMTSDESLDQK